MGTDDGRHTVNCNCKVGSVAESYDIGGITYELEDLWTADGDEGYSLRELADYFNRAVLESAMRGVGIDPLDGDVANVYRLLTDDEASPGSRVEAERRLEREGTSADRLRDDFVTHQTIYRHLKNCLEAEYQRREPNPRTRIQRDIERMEGLQNRTTVIVEEIVRRLHDAELVSIGGFDVYNDVRIVCEECAKQYSPRELLQRGGCGCGVDGSS
ncbi:rod-determining factor RdfA [Halomarina halobia]|uniref:Rod-determining factor RdfA n=1 Tax=Halomarina halobia TaxID=3033386 RepID=A0ABD6ACY3_9EURY|nr:rod-determining factor RdfA [Halomarina sp. PSR21]